MVWLDQGFSEIQSKSIRNEGGLTPDYLVYGGSDNTFTGSEIELNNFLLSTQIIWEQIGNNSKFSGIINSTEGNGSYFGASAIQYGSGSDYSSGSDFLFDTNPSYVGNKTEEFNVQLEGEIIMRRPNV